MATTPAGQASELTREAMNCLVSKRLNLHMGPKFALPLPLPPHLESARSIC
jgi:hypothetical protein